jgi:hypothetical protein
MWMLEHCRVRHDLVFFLDADEQVTPAMAAELRGLIAGGMPFDALAVKPVNVFLGRPLRFAYGHPRVRRIFRREAVRFRGEGAREYSDRPAREGVLRAVLLHHDRKPIARWVEKHLRNADREARLQFDPGPPRAPADHRRLSPRIRLKLLVRERIWNRLPLFVRPTLYFFYRYIVQLGFLDGRAGFVYCALHAFWYPTMIDVKLLELRRGREHPAP